jgi:hypothetical protein
MAEDIPFHSSLVVSHLRTCDLEQVLHNFTF